MKNKTKILNISESFNLTREALKGKQKQLKQQDRGNKPKRDRSGQSHNTLLFKTRLWLINSVQFNGSYLNTPVVVCERQRALYGIKCVLRIF